VLVLLVTELVGFEGILLGIEVGEELEVLVWEEFIGEELIEEDVEFAFVFGLKNCWGDGKVGRDDNLLWLLFKVEVEGWEEVEELLLVWEGVEEGFKLLIVVELIVGEDILSELIWEGVEYEDVLVGIEVLVELKGVWRGSVKEDIEFVWLFRIWVGAWFVVGGLFNRFIVKSSSEGKSTPVRSI